MAKVITPPVVMVFAGSDPTGGAGVTADIQTLSSLGCHPAVVVTAVTAQDTQGLKHSQAISTESVITQARAILEDMPVAAFKTGMLATTETLSAIATIVAEYAKIPLIVDPVRHTGGGQSLFEGEWMAGLRSLLLPLAHLVTPNIPELHALCPDADGTDACAQDLLDLGSDYVLVTGTHDNTPDVRHRLYGQRRLLEQFSYPRLPGSYHGSGCTLASACAALLAHGADVTNSIAHALDYSHKALQHGFHLGMGQIIPNRLYWCDAQLSNKRS